MRLRTRFLLVLAIFTLAVIAVALVSARLVLTAAAIRSDENAARDLLARGRNILESEVDALSAIVADWASWDDTYAFMADHTPAYRQANLVKGTLETLNVNAIAFYDTNRNPVAAVALDTDGHESDSMPREISDLIGRPGGPLDRTGAKPVSGFAWQGNSLWVIATAPVLTSMDKGPARGTLAMARQIGEAEREHLSLLIAPGVSLLPAAREWPPGRMDIRPTNARTLDAAVALPDISGEGRIALSFPVPRAAFSQMTLSLLYLTGWIVLCGTGLWTISAWLLDRWVLRSVTDSVAALRTGLETARSGGVGRPDLKKRRDDEIGELFDAIGDAIESVETSAREADRRRTEAIHSQRLAALGTLSAGVAHEINNPNGIVNLNLNVMRRELDRLFALLRAERARTPGDTLPDIATMENELRSVLNETLAASDRIAAIASSLKSFSRPAAVPDRTCIPLSDLLDEAVRWLRHEYSKSHCRLETAIPALMPPLWGNRSQLVQVLVNLLQNACLAAPRPDMAVRVSAYHDRTAGEVAISVADEGIGMPAEVVEHAMDPFFTTRRGEGGTGLGLSISAAIVKAHGGSMRIESHEGKGTVVTVILPVAQERDTHVA